MAPLPVMFVYYLRLEDRAFVLIDLSFVYAPTAVRCIAVSYAVAALTRRPIHTPPIWGS